MDTTNNRPKILIVDDDQLTLTLLTTVLEQNGYEVVQAKDGEDALNIMVLEEPDMALLDINLPGISGLDLAKRLHDDTTLPFMFLSGVADEIIVRRAVEYGAAGYLVKPVNVHTLVPTLEASMARATELRESRQRESKLTSALAAGRETSIAVGILMERYRVGRQQSFAMLRAHARSNRKTINDVALMILDSTESLNQLRPSIETTLPVPRPVCSALAPLRSREEKIT